MKKSLLLWGLLGGVIPFAATLVVAGCGGSGGPLKPPDTGGGGTSTTAAFRALLSPEQQAASYVGSDACRTCHETGANGAPVVEYAKYEQTRHAQIGVGCEQCHGPGGAHVAAPSGENILAFPNLARSEVCAQCHGPMAADYHTSPHADAVEDVVGSASPSKTCLRCHSAPFRADWIDAKLTEGKTADEIDANILAKPADRVAAMAAGTKESASCVNCHTAMVNTDIPSWESGKKYNIRYEETNTDTSALAPGTPVKTYTTINHACGTCHNNRGGGSDDAALTSGTTRPSFHHGPQFPMLMGTGGCEEGGAPPAVRTTAHANAPGQCVHCHMPNAKHTMVVNFDKSCAPCHSPGDAAARYAIRGAIEARLVALLTRLQNWSNATFGDPDLWNYTSYIPTGKTAPSQSLVPIEVKRARHNYYFVLYDKSFGVHNSTYTRYLLDLADSNLNALGVGRAATEHMTPAKIKAILANELRKLREYTLRQTD